MEGAQLASTGCNVKLRVVIGAIAAMCMAVALVAINAHDQAQEPATDTADTVATLATLGAAATWFALRWADTTKLSIQLIRSAAAGVALGALVTGLVSVVYDPWAN
jgi:hypothetical protein